MASERQVTVWIGECLKAHLRPDVLWVESVQNVVRVVTRKPGTKGERGPTFVVVVRQEETDPDGIRKWTKEETEAYEERMREAMGPTKGGLIIRKRT